MKKNKLKLNDFKVSSFTTDLSEKVKGGSINYYPTKQCPTDGTDVTGVGLGLCEAATRRNC